MFVLIKEVVFVEWFRIRKIPFRIPRNFKLNSENSEKSSTNCSARLCNEAIISNLTSPTPDLTIISGQNEVIQANKNLLSLFSPTLQGVS